MAVIPLWKIKPGLPRYATRRDDHLFAAAHALIDDDLVDHPNVGAAKWYYYQSRLSETHIEGRRKLPKSYRLVYLHRTVWEIDNGPIPLGMTIDHINRDTLDNRRENLRLADKRHQNTNKKKRKGTQHPYKGIMTKINPDYARRPHEARVLCRGSKSLSLGLYATIEEAAFAYNLGATVVYGEYACLNEIPEGAITPARQAEIRDGVELRLRRRGLIPSGESVCSQS